MADIVEIVVVRVLRHPSIEVRPCQNILRSKYKPYILDERRSQIHHGILLILDGLDGNFGQEVIMQHVGREVRLDRKAFREELLVKVLACLLAHEDAATLLVLGGTASAAHHLEDVHDRVIDVTMFLSFIELDTQDDNHIACHGKTPGSILIRLWSEKIHLHTEGCTLEAIST